MPSSVIVGSGGCIPERVLMMLSLILSTLSFIQTQEIFIDKPNEEIIKNL